jgi:hypothetical protein
MPIMLLLKAIFAAWSILFHEWETRLKVTDRGYPKNYVPLVRKELPK